MYYTLPLRTVGLVIGLALVLTHLFALLRGTDVKAFLQRFPRSFPFGVLLLTIALVWYCWVIVVMELGEFSSWRQPLLVFLPLAYLCAIFYLREFLAARALGILMLLAGMPILDAAFMRPSASRLLVVVLAYVWIMLGMWWTSSPYRLRDCLAWVLGSPLRWALAVWSGVLYGTAVLVCAFTQW